MSTNEQLSKFLPMHPVAFALAEVLDGHEAHAYWLMKEVARRTDGAVAPGPATVHRLLAQLVDSGLAEDSDDRPPPAVDDSRRRYYRLTELGRAVVRAEVERQLTFLTAAQARRTGGSS